METCLNALLCWETLAKPRCVSARKIYDICRKRSVALIVNGLAAWSTSVCSFGRALALDQSCILSETNGYKGWEKSGIGWEEMDEDEG